MVEDERLSERAMRLSEDARSSYDDARRMVFNRWYDNWGWLFNYDLKDKIKALEESSKRNSK